MKVFRLRSTRIGLGGALVLALIVGWYLSARRAPVAADPERLISELVADARDVVPELPIGKLPGYAVDDFRYVSAHGNETEWRLVATKAFLYRAEHLMHAREVQVQLESPGEAPTLVTATHAKFLLDSRKLDFFGNVIVTFPDGFEMRSQVMHYDAAAARFHVPDGRTVSGSGLDSEGMKTAFTSRGFDFRRSSGQIILRQGVVVHLVRPAEAKKNLGIPEETVITSDLATLDRDRNEMTFIMSTQRRIEDQFVVAVEPSLNVKSRKMRMRYRDFSQAPTYMRAEDDVTIVEKSDATKYATGGQADFDRERDVILLTRFPQVYQGQDTVTGETITMHRTTDMVEVSRSNAYSAPSR